MKKYKFIQGTSRNAENFEKELNDAAKDNYIVENFSSVYRPAISRPSSLGSYIHYSIILSKQE